MCNGYSVCGLVGGHVLTVVALVTRLWPRALSEVARFSQCDMPTHNFHAIFLFFYVLLHYTTLLLSFRPKFSSVSVSIFIGLGWAGAGEKTLVSALEIYDSNDHERAGMGSTYCGKNYRVGMRTK